MDYLLLKAAHLVAVMIWVGGLSLLVVSVSFLAEGDETVPALLDLDRILVTPAMLVSWILGLALLVSGDWLPPSPWLAVKLVLVFFVSACHGLIAGHLRKGQSGKPADIPVFVRKMAFCLPFVVPVIVLCVALKPGY